MMPIYTVKQFSQGSALAFLIFLLRLFADIAGAGGSGEQLVDQAGQGGQVVESLVGCPVERRWVVSRGCCQALTVQVVGKGNLAQFEPFFGIAFAVVAGQSKAAGKMDGTLSRPG